MKENKEKKYKELYCVETEERTYNSIYSPTHLLAVRNLYDDRTPIKDIQRFNRKKQEWEIVDIKTWGIDKEEILGILEKLEDETIKTMAINIYLDYGLEQCFKFLLDWRDIFVEGNKLFEEAKE